METTGIIAFAVATYMIGLWTGWSAKIRELDGFMGVLSAICSLVIAFLLGLTW